MKQGEKIANITNNNDRILFFDILKIFFIAIIVYDHSQFSIIPWFNNIFFSEGQNLFNIYSNGITSLAVYGMFFISGAVLEYNYKRIENFLGYKKFLFKRFTRLYPAFWMSLLFGLVVFITIAFQLEYIIIRNNLSKILFEYTGFYIVLGMGPGFINNMGWFIAAIVSLYILFPFLSKIVKKYQLTAILAFSLVGFVSRYLFYTYSGIFPELLWYWFPLCNLFEFSLGIYVVQNQFFPKNKNKYPIILQLVDLSFYVFLFHMLIIWGIARFLPTTGPLIFVCLVYVGMWGIVFVVCWIIMIIDKQIQQTIRQNEKIKKFLQS